MFLDLIFSVKGLYVGRCVQNDAIISDTFLCICVVKVYTYTVNASENITDDEGDKHADYFLALPVFSCLLYR